MKFRLFVLIVLRMRSPVLHLIIDLIDCSPHKIGLIQLRDLTGVARFLSIFGWSRSDHVRWVADLPLFVSKPIIGLNLLVWW